MHDCDSCHYLYNRRGEHPPCEECVPEILPGNEDAVKVWKVVKSQYVIAGMGTPVDINVCAISDTMRIFRIEDQEEIFLRVLRVCRELIAEARLEAKAKEGTR